MVKRYRVTGGCVVAGHRHGEEFEHRYLEHEEKALLAGGAVVVVPSRRAEKDEPKQERQEV